MDTIHSHARGDFLLWDVTMAHNIKNIIDFLSSDGMRAFINLAIILLVIIVVIDITIKAVIEWRKERKELVDNDALEPKVYFGKEGEAYELRAAIKSLLEYSVPFLLFPLGVLLAAVYTLVGGYSIFVRDFSSAIARDAIKTEETLRIQAAIISDVIKRLKAKKGIKL